MPPILGIHIFWFALLGVLMAGYAILDGFDLGVGMLHLLARVDQERRLFMNSIGPLWDGNAVWGATAYWAYLVVARLGWWPEARRLRDQLTSLINAHGFREFYDVLTGQPGGAGAGSGFTWPALVLDMTVPPDDSA